ncbi:hypothetical protein ABZS52_18625 [Micromonospora profundi]|uniref:hypothetical protein n=1 Tax=Micromonospora profundi TaxID=1420889 RepID=UPI0033BACDD5
MRPISSALAVAVVATAAVTVAASPAQAGPTISPCRLDRTVAELTSYGDVKKYNVIVYVGSAEQSSHFEKVVQRGSQMEYGCNEWEEPFNNMRTYHWVVFSGKGNFVRKGDGGYRNWAFFGVFDRVSDKKVVFHAR